MASIQTLAFKITADTQGFVNGLGMTRKELSAAKQLFESTRSPIEKYESALKGIEQLQAKGLSADVAERSIKKLREEFWGLDRAAERANKPVDNLFAKIAGGVTVGNLLTRAFSSAFDVIKMGVDATISNVETQFKEATKIGKLSERTGMDSMSLGGFELIASRTGMEFDMLTNSLQKMQIRIGEASRGGGEMGVVFKQLGLNAQQLADSSVDRQFISIAQALKTIPNDTERLAIAAKIFEAEGTDMARLFGLTADEVSRAKEEARRMGIALDEADLYQIEKANEALREMEMLWKGIGRTLAIEVAPALQSVLMVGEQLGKNAEAFSKFAESPFVGLFARNILGPHSQLYAQFGGLMGDVRAVNEGDLRIRKMQEEQTRRRNRETAEQFASTAVMDMTFGMMFGERRPETDNWGRMQREEAIKQEQDWQRQLDAERNKLIAGQQTAGDRFAEQQRLNDAMFSSDRITADQYAQAISDNVKTFNSSIDQEVNRRMGGKGGASGPTSAVLKGSSEAFAAELERTRIEDERYRDTVKREQTKLQVLQEIATNTKAENRMMLEMVEI